ncbi:MAG: DUF4129 domain-containing protein [Clostridia bacterium]|nr:DUF4129 domain-containing protein [Clostridia bacterium]
MTSQSYERVFNIVSAAGVAMLMIPLFLILLGNVFPYSMAILPFAAAFATMFGYGIQWLFGAVTGKRASEDGYDDYRNGVFGRFRIAYAAIPLTINLAVSAGIFFLFDRWLYGMSESGVTFSDGRFIHYTVLYAIFAAGLFFLASTAGCVIWFYPIERLSNVYTLIGGCVLFFIESFFLWITARAFGIDTSAFSTLSLGLPFAIFFVCVLIIYNQSNLQRRFRGSVVAVITGEERRYNLFLVFLLLCTFAVATGIAFVIVAGIVILLRMLLYIILFRAFHNVDNSSSYEAYEYVDSEEAGRMFRRNVMSPENQYIVAVFVLIVAAAILVIIGIKTGLVQKFLRWLREFIDTILIGSSIIKSSFDPNEEEGTYNYKDEKRKLQNAGIRDYDAMAASTDSYRLFLQRLGRLRTYDEQLCYAYAVLLRMYKKMNIPLKISDTPRENEAKVTHALAVSEIQKITADFESVRYAGHTPDDSEAAAILNEICAVIKRYLF